MSIKGWYLMVLALSWFLPGSQQAGRLYADTSPVHLSDRHIVILQADLEYIWGTCYIAVINTSTREEEFETFINLPDQMADFRPEDGLTDGDLKLDDQGRPYVRKQFRPGMSLLGVGFKVLVTGTGPETLSFRAKMNIPELSIATPTLGGLRLAAANFREGIPPMLSQEKYRGVISKRPIMKDESFSILIRGIPKERPKLQMVALIVAVILAISGILLTLRTRSLVTEKKGAITGDI